MSVPLIRFLLAIAFVTLCASGAIMWTLGSGLVPWWLPFALAAGGPAVVAVAILIIGGPK